jgi:hypothetical protein
VDKGLYIPKVVYYIGDVCMSRKSMIQEKKCPRCGKPYKYTEKRIIAEQTYYYAIHIFRDTTGKKHVHKCYMGAENYIYVKRVHEDSSIQFHGYTVENRYKEYMRDIRDYINRDKKHGENKTRVWKRGVKTEIEPFVKQIYSSKGFKVPIIVINALYKKYKAYALDAGLSEDAYNNIWDYVDDTLSKAEIEQYISMNIEGGFKYGNM